VRGLLVVGLLFVGYVLAFVGLQPVLGDGVIALTTIPVITTAVLYGFRGGMAAGIVGVVINISLMQTVGGHDGFRATQIPRIVVALGLGAGAGWARDTLRRQHRLLAVNQEITARLHDAKSELERQVSERTADLTAANATLEAEVIARRDAEERIRNELENRRQLEARAAAADRMAVVGTLTAGIGHEINNPLAVVIANLDFAVDRLENAPPGVVDALRDAQGGAKRAGEIVRNMRVFIHSNSERESADVRQVVTSAVQMVANELRHRAELEIDIVDTAPVAITESQLGQVMLNLLTNATHALPESGTHAVRVEVRPIADRSRVQIRISDTGQGVSDEARPRIFEPFFTTKPIGAGTGLGLWVCHHLVTTAGGSIELESSGATGTTFRIELPIARPVETSYRATPHQQHRGKLLVIDDDSAIRRAINRFMRNRHELVIVETAVEGLAMIEAGERFDVILCDLMMPEMDGPEFFRRLEAKTPDQAARVIFMTGGAFTRNATEFIETKRRLIEKPFEPVELEGMIQEVLDLGARA